MAEFYDLIDDGAITLSDVPDLAADCHSILDIPMCSRQGASQRWKVVHANEIEGAWRYEVKSI